MTEGSSPDLPKQVGEPDDLVRRVRVIVPVEGLARGSQAWLTGTGVDAYLASGALVDITTTQQKRRMWRVGAFTYTSFQEASRVAAAQGTVPIEVA